MGSLGVFLFASFDARPTGGGDSLGPFAPPPHYTLPYGGAYYHPFSPLPPSSLSLFLSPPLVLLLPFFSSVLVSSPSGLLVSRVRACHPR